jgi:hypothetical protein
VQASATSFPLSKHTGGGDTAPIFSGLRVYLQFTWEVLFPPPLWSFQPTTAFTTFPTPGYWACAAAPAFSSWLVRDFPSPTLWCTGHPTLFATCLCFCYCLLFSFSFFPGCGSVCPGGYADLAQGCFVSTAYRLAHLVVCVFPSRLGVGNWRCGSPPGFSTYHGVGMLCAG